MANIQNILNDLLDKVNESKQQEYQPYNLFTMWDMSENDHTKLLLSLLRFNQSNGYALIESFMKRFANVNVNERNIIKPDSHVEIYYNRKYVHNTDKAGKAGNSFIDGLILIKDNTDTDSENNCAIIIENKIKDAPDQPDQVRRYIYHMIKTEKIELENIWCFYIASDGSKSVGENSYTPSDESKNMLSLKISNHQTGPEELNCDIEDRFVELNYKYDITSWLKEDILDKRIYPESLTSVTRAYLESLEKDLFNDKPYEDLYQTILKTILPKSENNPSVEDLLTAMDEKNFKTLYSLYDEVSKRKNTQDKKKGTDENYEEISNLEELRRGLKSLISKIERNAFDEFERYSVDILNNLHSEQLCKKGLKWQVKHRGLSGEKGFIQLRLDNRWDGAHLEWIPINTTKMYTETDYILTLHVENNQDRKDDIIKKLQNPKSISKNCICKKNDIKSDVPLARMSPGVLYKFLSKVYNDDDIKKWCMAIIETIAF